jgi:hypothetical protein
VPRPNKHQDSNGDSIFGNLVQGERAQKAHIYRRANTHTRSDGDFVTTRRSNALVGCAFTLPNKLPSSLSQPLGECVLFIGTRFSNLHTAVDTPAEAARSDMHDVCVIVCKCSRSGNPLIDGCTGREAHTRSMDVRSATYRRGGAIVGCERNVYRDET